MTTPDIPREGRMYGPNTVQQRGPYVPPAGGMDWFPSTPYLAGTTRKQWRSHGKEHRGRRPTGDAHARWAARVDTSAGPDACWLWTGKTDARGYGLWYGSGRRIYVQQRAYGLAFGWTEANFEMRVKRTCGNRLCVQPQHLKLESRAEAAAHARQVRSARVAQRSMGQLDRLFARERRQRMVDDWALDGLDGYVTLKAASVKLGRSYWCVYRFIRTHQVPVSRVGGTMLVRLADLRALKQTTLPTAA